MSTPPVLEPPQVGRERRLLRSRDDRVIAGVAGGIATYLGMDAVLVRLVLVVLALAGGAGILIYAIAWLVIPDASVDGAPPVESMNLGTPAIAGLALIALGTVMIVDRLVPAFSWRFVSPLLLVGVGALLVVRGGESR